MKIEEIIEYHKGRSLDASVEAMQAGSRSSFLELSVLARWHQEAAAVLGSENFKYNPTLDYVDKAYKDAREVPTDEMIKRWFENER
jgi:hypothetical protein